MKPLVSIIVPVYNVEPYLRRCLDSMANQTYRNLEIVLVNDGSTDNSKSICEQYASKDSRIIVLNQKNSGSSIARNNGLDVAQGDIICFVDSDDHIDVSMLDEMVHFMKKNDLDVVEIDPRTEKPSSHDIERRIEDTLSATKRIIASTGFSVWRRIYKRKLVEGLRFIPGIIHQDVYYTIDVLNRISKLGYIKSPLYLYNTDNLSVIRSKYTTEKIKAGIRATEYIMKNTPKIPELNQVINNYVTYYYTDHFFLLSRNTHVDPDLSYRKKIKKEIFRTSSSANKNLRTTMVKILPIRIMEVISRFGVSFKKFKT
ncbi:glycosyltransferase [Hyunsoonleella sp. SJ7]|uniref:Glycosyltransferase n=1 Tax=Hyunsoonleella aquatilis TaxID=2762758 RepID=A0A923HCN2_9FLAO|nr:glycosyltransferase [Hyunsoonleella aquatilis]MBC3758984.1 glycosyltransferase [Hyunsoonleella aquatilis]